MSVKRVRFRSQPFKAIVFLLLLALMAAACTSTTPNQEAAPTTAVEEPAAEEPTEEPAVEEPTEEPAEEEPTEEPAEEEPTEEPAEEEPTEEPAEEEPTEEASGDDVEVNTELSGTLRNQGFGMGDEIATVRVERFQEMYPNVELEMTEGALDEQQFLTAVASGNPPDIIYIGRDLLSTYASRGAIMPLDECIASMDIDMSQYREAAVAQVTVDGQVYGIPEFYNLITVLVNTPAVEEAGLTLEDLDMSDWDSIAAFNEALTVNEGELSRIGFDPKLPEFLPLWVAANGGALLSEDGRTATLNSPEVVEALEFTAGLHEVAGGRENFIAFRDTWDFFGSNNQFVANQIGAFPMEQWYVNVLTENSPDAEFAAIPFLTRDGEPITFATGSAWAIPVGSANPEAACAFAKTMTAPDTWAAAAQVRADAREEEGLTFTGTYTANSEADDIIFNEIRQPSDNETFESAVETILSVLDSAFVIPPNPAGAEVRQAWTDAVNRVLNGEQTAQEALDEAQDEAQDALDDAWDE